MVQFGKLSPTSALSLLFDRLERIETESLKCDRSELVVGRLLAKPIQLDRDSPACDVSAMDGFAVRIAELLAGDVPFVGECRIGEAPVELAPNSARQIFTGSPLPNGADTVVRLEHAETHEGQLRLLPDHEPAIGSDIRRQGENAKRGQTLLDVGSLLTPAAVSALASTNTGSLEVYRALSVTVLTTGNELVENSTDELAPWQLHDSNGPTLAAMLSGLLWIKQVVRKKVVDSLDSLTNELSNAVAESDAVVLTGGVSKGDYDFVSAAVKRVGGEALFHGIMARPGRPTLGAVVGNTPVIGLPGNPLAVLTSGRRMLMPTLRHLAGFAAPNLSVPTATLSKWQGKTIPLTWWRPVRLDADGLASLVSLRGSGDVCGPAASDGFVEVAPNSDELGPHPFYSWLP